MFAKVFSQIFDSSIAEDFTTRHVFMDMLVLADSRGGVDMTLEAIARRTNVPIEVVAAAIEKLSSPDVVSRSPEEEGRRIVLMDPHRSWGWWIVNYEHYKSIRDEEGRRAYFRDYQRRKRADQSVDPEPGKPKDNLPTTPNAKAVAKLFSRRETTRWSDKEVKAFKLIGPIDPDDMKLLEEFYQHEQAKGEDGRQRRDLLTFLNNFAGELDKARIWKSGPKNASAALHSKSSPGLDW